MTILRSLAFHWRIFAFFATLGLVQVVAAPLSPDLGVVESALAEMGRKHRKSKSLDLRFQAFGIRPDGDSAEPYKGRLEVRDSSSFRLEYPAGLVVSNGLTLWEWHPVNNQVIIRKVEGEGGFAGPGSVLTRFLQAKPMSASLDTVEKKPCWKVVLDPKALGGYDSVTAWIDPVKKNLVALATLEESGSRLEYRIVKLILGARFSKDRFTFTPPEQSEIIDQR